MGKELGAALKEACRSIQTEAQSRNVPLRLVGSFAIKAHCPRFGHMLNLLGREEVNDLDFASRHQYGRAIKGMFEDLGFVADRRIELATAGQHRYFVHPSTRLGVDVYLDLMNYCHPLEFAGRLDADDETLPLAELLLAKMQIVQLTEKDVKDTIVLLLEHDVGSGDGETVNVDRIGETLAHDWGFCYTVTTNLRKVAERIRTYTALSEEDMTTVIHRIGELERRIEEQPKDLRWKLRARVGIRRRWYQEVEEKE